MNTTYAGCLAESYKVGFDRSVYVTKLRAHGLDVLNCEGGDLQRKFNYL